jgi:BlaI family transcriptional regulator, penicillinase repressor
MIWLVVSTTCVVGTVSGTRMSTAPKLTKLELRIMEAIWKSGACSVREIQETFPKAQRPAYTTVQTTVYRLEAKKVVRRAKKISNAHIFEATVSRAQARGKLIDDFLNLFGGTPSLLMAHLIEAGKLTKKDIEEAEKALLHFEKRDNKK